MSLSFTIQQIDALKKEADALQPVNPEFEQKFWNKYRLEFNYNSNHIEGNTLTYGHTQLLLMFDKVGSDSYSLRELEEMKAHDAALKLVKEAALDPSHVLTEKFIKEVNQIILVRPYYKEAITPDGQPTRRLIEPGQYKKYPNSVLLENGEIFDYASPEETPAKMGDLIEWIRKEEESKELHPVQLAALVHYRFVRIHPFDDSNGRTSRLLMNYYLMRNGYAPIVIESSDKKNYLTALNRADSGDIDAFIEYISSISLQWETALLKVLKGDSIEEPTDFEKEIAVLKKQHPDNYKREAFSISLSSDIFYSILLPMFEEILTTLSKTDDFFNDKRILFGINRPDRVVKNTDQIKKIFSDYLTQEGDSLELNYQHLEFAKSKETGLSYVSQLKVHLNSYTYSISIANKTNFIVKNYFEELSSDDYQALKGEISKNLLAFIKMHIGK